MKNKCFSLYWIDEMQEGVFNGEVIKTKPILNFEFDSLYFDEPIKLFQYKFNGKLFTIPEREIKNIQKYNKEIQLND